MPARRSFWTISVREARGHAFILCAVLWVVAAIDLGWPGDRNPLGQLKFPDFVHFYVQGDQASRGRFDELYDAEAQHARQAELVPASASDWFLPVYGPQTALLFLVFARLGRPDGRRVRPCGVARVG
jgi:hypothetical protein